MKGLFCAAVCLLAASLTTIQVRAQCPANPLNLISGTSWAFVTQDGKVGDATIGVFTATAPGVLNITESFNNGGSIGSHVTGDGSYSINPDCSGGTLYFDIAANPYQFQFVFARGGTQMFMVVSGSLAPPTAVSAGVRGTATMLQGAPSCSGVSNPLSLMAGNWSFINQDFSLRKLGS